MPFIKRSSSYSDVFFETFFILVMSSMCKINKLFYSVFSWVWLVDHSIGEIHLSTCLNVFSRNFWVQWTQYHNSGDYTERKMTQITVYVYVRPDFQVVSSLCISLITAMFFSPPPPLSLRIPTHTWIPSLWSPWRPSKCFSLNRRWPTAWVSRH